MWATLAQACRPSPATSSSCSTPASIRARTRRQARDDKQKAIAARIEDALQKVDSLDEDRILRHFVNAVQAAIRTNFYQTDKDGQPKRADRHQVREPQARRPAAAAPALRDLRLFAARRRRASALRQGGARRHPLVGPAAGFPHRDPRPGEGAAGQERGDRAGRRQGRLRAEAAAEGRRRARRSRPKASPPTSCSSRRCSTSPTISTTTARSCRPTAWCGTTTTIPISWSPPTRAPPPSPTSPTRIVDRARLLARRCLRLRRLGRLRPQEDGHHRARRLGIGQAPFPRDGRRHPRDAVHRASASATCRATCSATACCASRPRKLLAAFDHRDIFIDPDPDPDKSLRRAPAAVRSAALELAGLRQER